MRLILFTLTLLLSATVLAACTDRPTADPDARTILVTGVTGTQGGAVARELLGRGYNVRGLSRNPESERARAIEELGVIVVKGDFDDAESLATAMQGVDGVFAVTDFWEHGYAKEVAHGRQLIDAAKLAGVAHFVFTSVAGADAYTGIPHFETKAEIETYLRDSGLDYSIVRPVAFMDSIRQQRRQIMTGTFFDPRGSGKRQQWIASRDIGFFVGEAFDRPDEWQGKALDIAGDEMSLAEYADVLSLTVGMDVHHQQITWSMFEAEAGEEITLMMRWFDEEGFNVDIESLRAKYPNLLTFEQYLLTQDWN